MPDKAGRMRIMIVLSPGQLEQIDDFRFAHRIPSRAAAVRRLIEMGLRQASQPGAVGSGSLREGP